MNKRAAETSFTERVEAALVYRKMSQADLAEAIGSSRGMVTHWLRYDHTPRIETAAAMACALGVSLSWLMDVPEIRDTEEDEKAISTIIKAQRRGAG